MWKPHTLTGQLALWLMLAHAIWATHVVQKDKRQKRLRLRRKEHRAKKGMKDGSSY